MSIQDHLSSSTRKRVLFWGGMLLGAMLLCCVLIVVVAQKVINRDAFKSRIESAISDSLGGTVSYDRLELVLLPRPELEFMGLKVVIPGTASASIGRTRLYAKLLPLFLGRFEVSSVTFDQPALDILHSSAAVKTRSSRKPDPSGLTPDKVLTVAAQSMPDISLKIVQGRLSMTQDAKPVFSLGDLEAVVSFSPGPQNEQDRSGGPETDRYLIEGRAQCTIGGLAALPGPLRLTIKEFTVQPGRLSVADTRMQLLDGEASIDGSIEGPFSQEPRPDLELNGSIGRKTADWLRTLAGLPADLVVRAPIAVSKTRLRSSGAESARSHTLAGSAVVDGQAKIAFSLRRENDRLIVEKLRLHDGESDARLTFEPGADDRVLSFAGMLTKGTLDRLFAYEPLVFGWIRGEMRFHLPPHDLSGLSVEGALEGEHIGIPSIAAGALVVDRFSISGGDTLSVQSALLSLGSDTLTLKGTAAYEDDRLTLDLDVSAGRIDIKTLREMLRRDRPSPESTEQTPGDKTLTVDGKVRLRTAALVIDRYTFSDVSTALSIGTDRTSMEVQQAHLCGIGLNGSLVIEGRTIDLTAQTTARGGSLENSIRCIIQEEAGFSGLYDLSGRFTGHGTWDELLRSLQGTFALTSMKGRVHSKRIIKGIIAYLNSTSMFKGSRDDILDKGFPYDAIAFRGSLKEGVITLSEGTIRSKEVHITADGGVDLRNGTLALNVLAAPFTSFDRLLGKIPLVKHIAGNALIVVPARVEGTFSEPKVTALPASSVGTNITNLMNNITKTPVKVVDPSTPQGRAPEPAAAQQ